MPRIKIAKEIIELADKRGNKVVQDDFKTICLLKEGDSWYVNALEFHLSFWKLSTHPEIIIELTNISKSLSDEYKRIINSRLKKKEKIDIQTKWIYFKNQLSKAFESKLWKEIEGAKEAIFSNLDIIPDNNRSICETFLMPFLKKKNRFVL
jgi:hypothetical protein